MIVRIVIVLCSMSIPAACLGETAPPGYEEVYKSPPERARQLMKYPYEQQLEIFSYSMARLHPPDLELSAALASNGKPILPILLDRLKKEKKEYLQHQLIYVLEIMDRTNDLDTETAAIATVREVIANMMEPFWREMSEKSLNAILQKQLPVLPGR